MTDYKLLNKQLRGFCEAEPFFVSLLANASALLFETLRDINWAGFYLMRGERLVLGPFQGKTACIHIETGRGVGGARVNHSGKVYSLFSSASASVSSAWLAMAFLARLSVAAAYIERPSIVTT